MTVGLSGWKHGLAFWQNGSDLTPHLLANLWLVSSICYTEVDIVLPSQGCLNMERNNGWKMLSTESGAQKVLNKCSFTILKIDIYLSTSIYLCLLDYVYITNCLFFKNSFSLVHLFWSLTLWWWRFSSNIRWFLSVHSSSRVSLEAVCGAGSLLTSRLQCKVSRQ